MKQAQCEEQSACSSVQENNKWPINKETQSSCQDEIRVWLSDNED